MLHTKVEIAEKVHDSILERIVIAELDLILVKQIIEKAKHGSKEIIAAISDKNRIEQNIKASEKLLLYMKQKISMYKNDEGKKKAV